MLFFLEKENNEIIYHLTVKADLDEISKIKTVISLLSMQKQPLHKLPLKNCGTLNLLNNNVYLAPSWVNWSLNNLIVPKGPNQQTEISSLRWPQKNLCIIAKTF